MSPATETVEAGVLGVVRPSGWRILVRVPPLGERTKGGVILPEATRKLEETASAICEVVAVGPDAYKDAEKFPDGIPWCQVGDMIIMRQYSGTRIKIDGQEHRLINDDTVEAVVSDPSRVERV